jgi:hypothetical protein
MICNIKPTKQKECSCEIPEIQTSYEVKQICLKCGKIPKEEVDNFSGNLGVSETIGNIEIKFDKCKHSLIITSKPIPAEKKDYDCLLCIYHGLCMAEGSPESKCATYKVKPEPKPKERIEVLSMPVLITEKPNVEQIIYIRDKINEIIHFINNRR